MLEAADGAGNTPPHETHSTERPPMQIEDFRRLRENYDNEFADDEGYKKYRKHWGEQLKLLSSYVRDGLMDNNEADEIIASIIAEKNRGALTDRKTNTLNSAGFEDEAQSSLTKARREGSPVSLAVLDIDFFKRINDTHGHLTGDAVLNRLGDRLNTMTREDDIVARWGGEEFIILFPNMSEEDIYDAVRRIRKEMSPSIKEQTQEMGFHVDHPVTTSIGIVESNGNYDLTDLMATADDHLYIAKKTGRDKIVGTLEAATYENDNGLYPRGEHHIGTVEPKTTERSQE
jgi:diguanylate cyclase (GGDEF)-like protein